MTTIACDGNSMAGDGYITSNGTILIDDAVKVHRLQDGSIIGLAGSAYNWDAVIFHMSNMQCGGWPKIEGDFAMLHLQTDGECYVFNSNGQKIKRPLPTAIGTGREFAIGAMDAGIDPGMAVHIAKKRDIHSGGKMTHLALEDAA